ncbi:piggyBac transposable element-derived protein 4-like [Osmia bicornis bicornis]|uniref:piggyBac transposable element-derived protein 4-like n=1 Tax=Osmia bicornis bicornis TaxID=1437191 RepID=UPI001EAEC6C5|nr:piggyBac transposable element-derived protein 4-like [Osmia bicornis bicornis]
MTSPKMSSNPEEYITRDDSEIGNDYDSSASMNNVYQFAPLSSDSDEDTDNIINNRLAGRKSINRKRPRLLSTSSEEEDSNLSPNIENCDQTGRLLWSKNNLSPTLHIFDEHNSGVKGYLNAQSTPLDAFQMFFSEELVSQITTQTNNYCKYVQEHTTYKMNSRGKKWRDASISEMYQFLCVTMLMPRMKKLSLREYWSTDEMLKTNIFRQIMARDRYMLLLQMLHFNDNNITNDDPLTKIRPVVDKLKISFSQSFTPYENLCIDESLLLYKGRCYFKQFIPSKRSRFGIKTFLLCDCKTNYILDFIIYTGRKTDINENNTAIGISGNVVMTLLQPYLEKGHTLITDNWYTSPRLFTLLHQHKTNAFGTVRKNRSEMPHMEENLKRGEICYRSTNILLAMKWRDKKDVWILSSVHAARLIEIPKKRLSYRVK